MLSKHLGGMKVAGNWNDEAQKLIRFCEDMRFDLAIKRHNNDIDGEHIQAHKMFITSMQWMPKIHYGLTTVHDIMNIGRAINAGEITFYTDGTFGMCKNEVCLIGVRVGKRCYGCVRT